MASPRLVRNLSNLKHGRKARALAERLGEKRRLQLESLEDRRLMAVGPSLVSILPNSGVFLNNNDTLNVAPRDLTFRFAQGNVLDGNSLANGFVLTSAGNDHILGNNDDQVISPGYLNLGDSTREVVMRFASTLPDNVYSVTLVGATDPMHPSWSPIKDISGNPFNSGDPSQPNLTVRFALDTGSKISAVVPQPISRNSTAGPQFNALTQSYNTIDVYFDQQMNTADATQPGYYRLIDATNGSITLPASVKYSDDSTLSIVNSGATSLSYNGVAATSPLIITNQTTRVSVTSAGVNNAGTFTLTVNGATTSSIAANGATAANVLAALNAIPALKGNVSVAVGPGGVGVVEQFDITFAGTLTGRNATVVFNPIGNGTAGTAVNAVNATNLPASGGAGVAGSIQNNLNSIPGLAGKVAVTGPAGGPYNIQFIGALAGANVRLVANAVATATVPASNQTLTLVTSGTTLLSFNGVNATLPLNITTGATGTTAAGVTANLNTIPALAGHVAVTGPSGGPFSITITNPNVGLLSSLVKSSTANVTLKTNTQTLNLVTNGITNLSFNGANATSALTVVTGINGTQATAVQANLNTIPGLAGNFGVTGANGGPFTITYTGTASTSNASLVATNPSGVVVTITDQPKATLTFANAIQGGAGNASNTFKLEVGTTTEPDDRITTAQHIGNSMTTSLAGFIGDNPTLASSAQANDVDLYRFDVKNAVTDFSINVAPSSTSQLDTYVRIFQADGTPFAALPFIDNPGAGVADDVSGIALPAGVYYIGVSSKNNINYDPNVNGTAAGGTATGAYSIKVSFTDAPTTLDDTTTFDNSSFGSPTVLGVLGNSGQTVTGATIAPNPDISQQYGVQLPGAGDAPGDRNIPFEGHTTTVPGRDPDPNSGIETVTYDFQQVYGYTPQGQQFTNAITEAQKQRAREALELYSRYLGVQFKEAASSEIADMTIATGDPRAIAPTISTGTGDTNNGTNGIAGTPSIVTNADPTNMFTHVISDVSNTSPIVITSANHGLAEGSKVNINGVLGNTAANGVWTVHVIDSTHFSLNNSVGNNPYGGGGTFGVASDIALAIDSFIAYARQNQIVITSPAHGLTTGQFVYISGAQGMTSANGIWKVTVLDQDHFFLNDQQGNSQGNGIYQGGGTWTALNISKGVAVVNALVNWGDSQYGGEYFQTVMHEIGHLLGLGDNFEAPALTIMGAGEVPSQAANAATAEPVFPGDADIVYGQAVHRPENRDIDLYQFTVTEPGLFRSETIAERLSNSSSLNTVLTLYQESADGKTRTQIARNDDYYGNDSYLELHLDKGTYYIAVTSVGNTDFDPTIPDTGFGGRTQGTYNLTMSLKPDSGTVAMRDATGVAIDGDAENNPGGTYQFWFQANTAANTIYVDKTPPLTTSGAAGSITNPFTGLVAAMAATNSTRNVVRIVGNGGTDGNVNTFIDDKPYLVGYKDPNSTQPLSAADGGEFQVPQNVTVMIDAGAAFKMRRSNLNAGTTLGGGAKGGGAIQVLGTPNTPVLFTSYADDTVGGDSDGPSSGPMGGDYGGIVYRDDSDHERDYLSPSNPLNLAMPVFLNYVNHATMTYGGGKVKVNSVEDVYDPIYLDAARPSLSFNTIQQSANAGASANPNTFDDDGLPSASGTLVKFDDRRIGPDIHDNTVVNNSLNGLFIRVKTQAGNAVDFVDVPTRWNDTDIVHIVTENLEIAGTPGGSVSSGADRATTTQTDGRLRIDPGMTVKLGGSRIEAQISSQFIAEGTQALPIVFTSLKDDRYGANGTFDTNRDGQASAATPGDWGGLVFEAASTASIAQSRIFYGGGSVPIEGGFDSFNAIEIQQADVRLVNSLLQYNAAGGSNTDRNGRGPNDDAVIFVRGAQPIIANDTIRDNSAPAISINANAMTATVLNDYGQSTGLLNRVGSLGDNQGPLVRGNRLTANTVNGMVVRGGTLTTETVWDDTDMVHVLFDEIVVPNHQVYSGLRIQSQADASLVVKSQGANAGITASGTPLDIADRIGGTVQIIGAPGFPVVMTSLFDDSVGAGFDPNGLPNNDTNGDGTFDPIGTLPTFPPATGGLQVTPNGNASQLATALVKRGLPQGVTITNSTYTGSSNAAGTYINGDNVPLGIPPEGVILTSGDANIAASNTSGSFTRVNSTPGDADLTVLANKNNKTGVPISTFDASSLTLTINVDPNSNIKSGAISFVFGSEEYNEFVGSPFNDVFGIFVNGGAATNVARDSRGNLISINSSFFDVNNLNNKYKIEYDGFTAALTATFPLHAGANTVKFAIADSSDTILDSGVLMTDLRFSTQSVGLGGTSVPAEAGDWRGVKLDNYSNDRNVAEILESENGSIGTNADITAVDKTRTPQNAQFLGSLAPNQNSGDDRRRLGFQVDGTIALDNPADTDVYSFNADSGTEVWVDIDRTSYGLDSMLELVDANGNVLARATDTNPDVSDPHNPVVPTDPGLSGSALSFNKDPYNGRDTYSTNVAATRKTATGTIESLFDTNPPNDPPNPPLLVEPGVTNSFPISIRSVNHGLSSGDRVEISGVTGTTSANGVFKVTVLDADHFVLNGSLGNGVYTGGGTWTKLVNATRDPIMRLVLPNGANGQPLKDSPFFIRVRSQPLNNDFTGESGNTLNPGLTSGAYQLQIRLQQKDEKPGSTIRFANIRYATNAIEVHGLPYHSPLAGETAESDNNANNNFAGAQNLGNLLQVDQNTLSVGGQLTSATDVDWYRFDLNFDLLQYVNGYTDGRKTWSTIFDLDYGDGLSRADTTLSVFDSTGKLILIGRDSGVQDDQGTSTANTAGGSFGSHDAYIGPAQLPAVVPGRTMTYYVAVSSDRMLPQVLDQTFNAGTSTPNVRLEPIEAVARVADDPLEMQIRSNRTSSGTAEFPDSQYIDPNTINQNFVAKSTLLDTTTTQSLQANVRPFSLADVQMFVSTYDKLYSVDPTVGLAYASARTDFQTTTFFTGQASVSTDFGTGTTGGASVTGTFTAVAPGTAGNNIVIVLNKSDLTLANNGVSPGPTVTRLAQPPGSPFTVISIVLDTKADAIANGLATGGTTIDELIQAIGQSPTVASLINLTANNSGVDIAGPLTPVALQLSGGSNTGGTLNMVFSAVTIGTQGNNIRLNFTRTARNGAGPLITVNGNNTINTTGLNTINITLDTTQHGPSSGTTAQDLVTFMRTSNTAGAVAARQLIGVSIVQGGGSVDIANPPPDQQGNPAVQPPLQLSGGNNGFGGVEGTYAPATNLRTANNSFVNDLAFRSDGELYGYEGISANNNGTAGRLILVDTGAGNATTAGNDSIPDDPATPVNPPTQASRQTLTSDGGDAFAWGGSVLPNGVTTTNTTLYYAVADGAAGASRLYRADPTSGSAALVTGQPWGLQGLITNATAATGSTDFVTASPAVNPTPPVTIAFRTIRLGSAANGGVIHFSASHLGFDPVLHTSLPPVVTINTTVPLDVSVNMNMDSSNATTTRTFSTTTNSTDIQFDAGANRQGSQGNSIVINLSRANRQGQGPLVQFGGTNNNTISVTLDTSFQPSTGQTGTSAQQFADAINNSPQNQGIITVTPNNGSVIISGTPITTISLAGGSDASTAQDVINAINAAAVPAGQPNPGPVLQATLAAGSGSTVVALPDSPQSTNGKTYSDVTLGGASDTPGFTMGLAFGNDRNTLYGVTDQGQFLQNISRFGGIPADTIPVTLPDPLNPGKTLSGANLRFAALTQGPQDVEGGRYANMFFAMTDTGILTALDSNGVPQTIFDTDGDGVVDSTAILTGASQVISPSSQPGQAPFIPVTGLAFSPFDFNLWHPTYERQDDAGHSMGDPDGLGTTGHSTLQFPASGRGEDSINASFYFGFEQWQNIPGYTTDSYQQYFNATPILGTNNANLPDSSGQYGLLDSGNIPLSGATRQRELSLNSKFRGSYNTPVGAYGSLTTDKFSLGNMSANDKPTFYFDYFLNTEDSNQQSLAGTGLQRDSARVYVGPFTRFDNTGGPFVTGSVLDPTATATANQFGGTSGTALSGENDFYKGKALQFTSGALNGQTHLITAYNGATKTFTFQDGFTAAPASGDSFRIAYGYVTWDLVATNNSTLDNSFSSPNREGELGTFISASTSISPSSPKQQVQLMHDNTGEWRQTRVDLSRYAGMTNLQLRFDFTTAGQMPDPKGHLPAWPQDQNGQQAGANQRGIFPPTNVVADPGQEYLYEDGFGNLTRIDQRQNNAFEGFYVDNIIIGPAERGEMVINAPSNSTNFIDLTQNPLTQPRNLDQFNPLPTQVLSGPYQLEIRRAAEYSLSDAGPANGFNYASNTQTPIIVIDTNDRLIPDQRLTTPIPVESFETQNFTGNGLKWSFNDDAPWIISNVASAGSFSAASGKITNGQSSGISIDLTTGGGNLTFDRSVDTEAADPATGKPGDTLRLFIDGRIATYTEIDGVKLATPRQAVWSGNIGFETITVPVAAGHHNFRWSYDKDASDPVGLATQDRVFLDNIHFPTPQVGVASIYEDDSLHQVNNPNADTPPISPTIAAPTSFPQIHFIDTLFPGFTRGGDTNLNRQQGHIQIEMNQIYAASQVGILIDTSRPQGTFNPTIGSLRNLPTLSTDRLVPGVTVSNNIVSNSGLAGIQYSGDANTSQGGLVVPTAAVPFGRIVNNTVWGSEVPAGTGILVTNNAGPTLLNNIVANTNLGISVDASSNNTTVLGANLYSNNNSNVPAGASTGSNPILLQPTDPLFIDAAHQNFYPAANSLAIDSSLNSLVDRQSIVQVKSAIGIPQSPILSPDRDIYGQLRVDDPSQNPPPGLGTNVFKDRGAVERSDFLNPTASMVEPVDNDNNNPFRDRNRALNDIAIRNENLTQFVVKLSDDGVGIDDFTVDHSKFTITMDGVVLNDQITAAALGVSPDYQFVYNAATDQAIFSPSAGIWPLNHTYRITINNNPVGATDSTGNPLPPGIFDLAGNPLAANRDTGEVSFSIFVGTLYDFGDAPSNLINQHYPVTLVDGGAVAVVQDGYYLGTGISEESDALQNATATADGDDPPTPPAQFSDGISFFGNPSPSKTTTIVNQMTVVAHFPAGITVSKLDAWFDLNRDGDWLDPGEKITLTNTSHPGSNPNDIFDGTNTFTYTFGDANTTKGATFARFRLSPTGVSSPNFVLVNGVVPDGEVEDKQILIAGPPFQNPKTGFPGNELDVNDDGVVSASDALTIINFINAKGSGPLALGQPPIPNPALGPGKSLYVDVNGDTSMTAADSLTVINFLNAQKPPMSGEGGSANTFAVAAIDAAGADTTSTANATTSDLIIPPVLVASPNVVLEVRDRSPVAALAVDQAATDKAAQDQALLDMSGTDSVNESLSLASNTKAKSATIDSADEASWDDLLTSLAEDHKANS